MENDELTIIDMKQVGLNTGQTRYKCLLSDNYALLNFDMRGNRLEGISVVAMGREGKYQKAIETLYSAMVLPSKNFSAKGYLSVSRLDDGSKSEINSLSVLLPSLSMLFSAAFLA